MSEQLRQQLKFLLIEYAQHPNKMEIYMNKIVDLFKADTGNSIGTTSPPYRQRSHSIFDGEISSLSSLKNQRRHSTTFGRVNIVNNTNSKLCENDGID